MKAAEMAEIHRLILEEGKEAAARSEFRRSVVEAAAGYLSEADGEIGFFYSGWAQAALPHKRLADDAIWQVENDRVMLLIQPGARPVSGGVPIHVGVPYGSRARLILPIFKPRPCAPIAAKSSWDVHCMPG